MRNGIAPLFCVLFVLLNAGCDLQSGKMPSRGLSFHERGPAPTMSTPSIQFRDDCGQGKTHPYLMNPSNDAENIVVCRTVREDNNGNVTYRVIYENYTLPGHSTTPLACVPTTDQRSTPMPFGPMSTQAHIFPFHRTLFKPWF